MPSHPADRAAENPQSETTPHEVPVADERIGPKELAEWLRARSPELAREWIAEIHARGVGQADEIDGFVRKFVTQLTSCLPSLLGPLSPHLEPLWVRACELFGRVAAKRGLAAGEVIEEFQILRELLIRALYQDPPATRLSLSLREVLRLNRVVDRGVTYASVGHTDAMFFEFFETQSVPRGTSLAELAREAETQLELIRGEMNEILGRSSPEAVDSPAN